MTSTDDAIPQLLTSIAATAAAERRESTSYRDMLTASTIGGVVRRLQHATTGAALDAFDVLRSKFGLEGTPELYSALLELPRRYQLYRTAYTAETHVGSIDRTVNRLAAELSAAGGQGAAETPTDPRHAKAALVTGSDGATLNPAVVADVLITADLADHGRRIQRLSCDVQEVTRRIASQHPDLSHDALAGTVRMILHTAAAVVRDQDGLET